MILTLQNMHSSRSYVYADLIFKIYSSPDLAKLSFRFRFTLCIFVCTYFCYTIYNII